MAAALWASTPLCSCRENLNEPPQCGVEILQIGEQLRIGGPIRGIVQPAAGHHGEPATNFTFANGRAKNLLLVLRTVRPDSRPVGPDGSPCRDRRIGPRHRCLDTVVALMWPAPIKLRRRTTETGNFDARFEMEHTM